MNRGDVVLVPFPYQDRPGEKFARPWWSRAMPKING
jgi:hypothetical protein